MGFGPTAKGEPHRVTLRLSAGNGFCRELGRVAVFGVAHAAYWRSYFIARP